MVDDLRILSWWVMAATFGGCAVEEIPDPLLAEVCLASVQDHCVNQAPVGMESPVLLLGFHFRSIFEVNLDDDGPPASIGRFSAWMGGRALEQVEFANQTLRGLQVIQAMLPKTLPSGTHPVELETPTGQRSELPDAFVVSEP